LAFVNLSIASGKGIPVQRQPSWPAPTAKLAGGSRR